ncbi:thiol reductant ABC exporter subunit CydC [Aquisalimonas asiatica]|uniref:ATP-binding cassette, subfamily C, CydC n=1 Tax=Aquisalimonas asiatica TaxID=406100 RepID=A0A1H8Q5Z0_9GAMM|nr:thiol reductant ABC exporter subunit CydC [Aquisalimonas asiatica]SEO49630.1 ATP-binding cassette, subfamily C, CydC [Aquisalimonas asiatica]
MDEFRPLLRVHAPRWPWLLAGGGLMLMATLAGFGLLALSGWFITATGLAGIAMAAGNTVMLDIYRPGAGIRFFAVGRAVSRYGERLVTHEAVMRLLADLRVWMFQRLMQLDLRRLGALRGGDTLARLTADVDRLDQFYLRLLAPVAVAAFGLVIAAVVLALFAPPAALAVTVIIGATAAAAALLGLWLTRRPGEQVVALSGQLRDHLVLALRGAAELRIYGHESSALQHQDALSREHERTNRTLARLAGLTQAGGSLATFISVWVAAVLTIPLVQTGALSGPGFGLVLLGTLALAELVTPLPMATQALARVRAAARRVVGAAPETTAPPPEAQRPGDGTVVLEGVRYRHHAGAPMILDGVGLTVYPGDRVAITGRSGTGKSSLLQLITGALSPESGAVRVGGDPVATLSPEAIGQRAAWMPQRTILFNGTVEDNLRMAAPDASRQSLWHALWLASLDDTVAALPEGLDTWLGESGRQLSGGEARRLTLARTLLQPAPVLLLDEPVRGLDRDTALAVMERLADLPEQRAVVVVTHAPELLPDRFRHLALHGGQLGAGV